MSEEWVKLYSKMLENEEFQHLHQKSGWFDISEVEDWEEYVLDVIKDKMKDNSRVFEVGCGCLAFLTVIKKNYKNITVGGIDGMKENEIFIKSNPLISENEYQNFHNGIVPNSLEKLIEDHKDYINNWDIILSNSMFQYLSSHEDAERTIRLMLKMSSDNGVIILSDIMDSDFEDETEPILQNYWGQNYKKSLQKYLYFPQDWWKRFTLDSNIDLEIKRVQTEKYHRKRQRYCVYLMKKSN
ncbi:arsenite methyltransferase [Anaeramoeba ignava]|uniref:Arsenite methyltransferase n=1 Tax=Anaeramoeba ignava TaxID=1746090 RepID=A0A9Q0LY40_ANAIG|nr:arsenite methyltransferase [Anaeramoeba ignava]